MILCKMQHTGSYSCNNKLMKNCIATGNLTPKPNMRSLHKLEPNKIGRK